MTAVQLTPFLDEANNETWDCAVERDGVTGVCKRGGKAVEDLARPSREESHSLNFTFVDPNLPSGSRAEYEADRRSKTVEDPREFLAEYSLELEPLPCWRHLPGEEYRRRIAEMVHDIEVETARRIFLTGKVRHLERGVPFLSAKSSPAPHPNSRI